MATGDRSTGDLVDLIEDGPLADHPGPVLLVGTDGAVLARNIPGAPFAHSFAAGELPAVTAMVAAVTAGTGPRASRSPTTIPATPSIWRPYR